MSKKIVVLLLAILTLAALSGVIVWYKFKKNISANDTKTKAVARKEIGKIVTEISDSLYRVSYSDFKLNIDSGFLLLNDLSIESDTAIYNKMATAGTAPNSIVSFKAKSITIDHFQLSKKSTGSLFHITNLSIENPFIRITNKIVNQFPADKDTSILSQVIKNFFRKIAIGNLDLATVDSISLRHLTLVFINSNGIVQRTTTLHNLSIEIDSLRWGSSTEKGIPPASQNGTFGIARARIATADNLYYIDVKDLGVVSNQGAIQISKISLAPRRSKLTFYKAVKRQNDRFQFSINDVKMNMDFKEFLNTQQFHISTMSVGSAKAEVYTNYNWSLRQPPSRRRSYPNDDLQQLAFDVSVDTMHTSNSDIYYRIVGQKSQKQGVLRMEHLQGRFLNITNNELAKKNNPIAKVDIQTQIMGGGSLKASLQFSLVDKAAPYKLSAILGAVDGAALNPLITPLALIQVKAGKISKMNMTMQVDEYSADGNVDLFYSGLKVNMLKHKIDDTGLRTLKLKTIAANLILPNDNPTKQGHFRKGPINTRRDPKESFFGFMWRSMLDGLTTAIIGLDQHKDEPHNIVTSITKSLAGPKGGTEKKAVNTDKQRPEHRSHRVK